MRILVVNAGSSSVKLRLVEQGTLLASHDPPAHTAGFDTRAMAKVLRDWPAPDAVGHRVVHGGTQFTSAVRLTPAVVHQLRALSDLAPLHQPASLAGIEAASEVLANVPGYACFDTAFHATIPAAAHTYALPASWREQFGVRRFGFHGLSHSYAATRGASVAGLALQHSRIITCHLGAGASLCAVKDGLSRDTTMGFTPLEGLIMATRSGSVDPGLVLWLQQHCQLTAAEVADTLENRSGVLALTGTADMKEVDRRAAADDPRALLGLGVYDHHLAAGIAAMAAALGGLDLLVFTGGVGENSLRVRAEAARRLAWLGLHIDDAANGLRTGDRELSTSDSSVRCVVVAAREDLQIAEEVRRLRTAPSQR
jgi:acetate kinase